MAERNALAELAEDLRVMSLDVDGVEEIILDKAQRIVDELAKVRVEAIKENPSMVGGAFINLMVECRAIAEESEVAK